MAGGVESTTGCCGSRVAVVNGEATLINNHIARRGERPAGSKPLQAKRAGGVFTVSPAEVPRGSSAGCSAVRADHSASALSITGQKFQRRTLLSMYSPYCGARSAVSPQGEHQSAISFADQPAGCRFAAKVDRVAVWSGV